MSRPLRLLLAVAPLLALVALLAVFAANINRDPSLVQSVLINKPAPEASLPAVAGLSVPGFDTARLRGQVTVVNVFASWCIPCRDEHKVLERLKAETGVALFGINQKDQPDQAAAFLAELGNPYDAIGADASGRASIDWGVYGVPETFVVDTAGIIRFKHTGPLSMDDIDREIVPAIARATQGS
ncbi:MAG: DsbE family thiol:disulfide interchange protein [Devosia sp.]